MKKIGIIIGTILIGILLYNLFLPQKIPVLTYHDFVKEKEEKTNNMQISKEEFEEEMKYLKKHHYKSLTLKEVECFLKDTCKIPRKSVLITMDDGWIGELTIAAPILKKYKLNAVIFYVGENVENENNNFMHEDSIQTLQKKYPNIELASHSFNLHYEDAYQLSKDDIKEDIKKMKNIIPSKYYAYPYGRYSEEYIKALKEEGYELAFGFGPDKEHRKMKKNEDAFILPRLNISNGMPMWKFILRLNYWK